LKAEINLRSLSSTYQGAQVGSSAQVAFYLQTLKWAIEQIPDKAMATKFDNVRLDLSQKEQNKAQQRRVYKTVLQHCLEGMVKAQDFKTRRSLECSPAEWASAVSTAHTKANYTVWTEQVTAMGAQ
jgi:hypothetical protein